jgi:hypothetical protein
MSKLALIGIVLTALGLPASATPGQLRPLHPCHSLSEMVSCGKHGVAGNREQFMEATSWPIEPPDFLRQLAH